MYDFVVFVASDVDVISRVFPRSNEDHVFLWQLILTASQCHVGSVLPYFATRWSASHLLHFLSTAHSCNESDFIFFLFLAMCAMLPSPGGVQVIYQYCVLCQLCIHLTNQILFFPVSGDVCNTSTTRWSASHLSVLCRLHIHPTNQILFFRWTISVDVFRVVMICECC